MKKSYMVIYHLSDTQDMGEWRNYSSQKAAQAFFDGLLTAYGPDRLVYRALIPWPPAEIKCSGKL